jgi:hypothetical protein
MNQHTIFYPNLSATFVSFRRTIVVLGLVIAGLHTGSAAVTWQNIQFGGFASQGFIANTGNNDYLGNTSEGTFDFREYAVNGSYSIGKFRIGAQVFGQKLGDYGDDKIKLDWAIVDYQATQWFGIRAGRVKMPRGLYNEALDLDSVRPFVLLPQSVYDARLRDFNAAFNGAMAYGNVELHSVGSLDYRLFYGKMPMSTKSGAGDYFNNDMPYPKMTIGIDNVVGGSLFWNTPIKGLRAGYSFSRFKNFSSMQDLSSVPGIPFPMMYKTAPHYDRHLLSVEYTYGDWVFAAEAGTEKADYEIAFPGIPPALIMHFKSKYGYASAARRVTSWLELGAYYSCSFDTQYQETLTSAPMTIIPDLHQSDYAVSARFDLNDHLIFKLEGHYMDGSGKLFNTPSHPQPVSTRDNSWMMLAAKITYSF